MQNDDKAYKIAIKDYYQVLGHPVFQLSFVTAMMMMINYARFTNSVVVYT